MKTLVVGYGEVGRAHFNILSKAYPGQVFYKDKDKQVFDGMGQPCDIEQVELMLIALQCDPKNMQPFIDTVVGYSKQFAPSIIDVLTTTPCGTVEQLQEAIGMWAEVNKSSVRGLHPHLDKFLLDIPKHIGGPSTVELRAYYEGAGITCVTHEKARAVELFHVLNNFIYGINILAADEAAKYCRDFAIDYNEFLSYRKTNNDGFLKSGFPSKLSPILFPLNNAGVGGHCVKYSVTTIPDNIKGPLAKMLEEHK
jgi:hypothetical protein